MDNTEKQIKENENLRLKIKSEIETLVDVIPPIIQEQRRLQYQIDRRKNEIRGVNNQIDIIKKYSEDDKITACINIDSREINKFIHEINSKLKLDLFSEIWNYNSAAQMSQLNIYKHQLKKLSLEQRKDKIKLGYIFQFLRLYKESLPALAYTLQL